MSSNGFDGLLGVKWYDGLLVSSEHMAHSDERVSSLLAEACRGLMDQPGVIGFEGETNTPSQLFSVHSTGASENGVTLELSISRSFVAMTPAGVITTALPGKGTGAGVPTRTFSIAVAADVMSAAGQLLLCASQESHGDLSIERRRTADEGIDLDYPDLQMIVVPRGQYEQRVTGDLAQYVAIGALTSSGGELREVADYIPPVTRLATVRSFDPGILQKITSHCDKLRTVLSENIEAAGVAFARGDVGADLMSRRSDYDALRAVLVMTRGMTSSLERLSPLRFVGEVAQPIAAWWIDHRNRHFPNASASDDGTPIGIASIRANEIMKTDFAVVCGGTDEVIRSAEQFLASLTVVLEVG
jgi:hypothetical protein